MMFVCVDPEAEPYDPAGDNIGDWVSEHDGSGARIMGFRLVDTSKAITVRKRKGKVLTTTGPFAETKEWIAGFDLIEAANENEAVAIAAGHPMARFGRIELRRMWIKGVDPD